MYRYYCCSQATIPKRVDKETKYIVMLPQHSIPDVNYFGLGLHRVIARNGFTPSNIEWDFANIAFSIAAIDLIALRKASFDGWTRELQATIEVTEPHIWSIVIPDLENAFRFLTGDIWHLSFVAGVPPGQLKLRKVREIPDCDCLSLLSGGMDSFIGALDFEASGRKPLYITRVVRGDGIKQKELAGVIDAQQRHFNFTYSCKTIGPTEPSTRARSIIFYAFAVLATSSFKMKKNGIDLYVPENGFISINLPLTPSRLGTLSTKTTHPIYLSRLQRIFKAVGIPIVLKMPYQFCTKGEMVVNCKQQQLLHKHLTNTTSCGRFGRYGYMHCGRCVPCLVRRASFQMAGIVDSTKYKFDKLNLDPIPSDIACVSNACLELRSGALTDLIGGALRFANDSDRPRYRNVIYNGLTELSSLLESHNVL